MLLHSQLTNITDAIIQNQRVGCLCGVVANVVDCDIKVKKFKLQ